MQRRRRRDSAGERTETHVWTESETRDHLATSRNLQYRAPAEPGQVREDDWRRWYVGTGDRDFMCRYETVAGDVEPQLLTLPAWMFKQGMVGRPVGSWTGDLLEPIYRDEGSN